MAHAFRLKEKFPISGKWHDYIAGGQTGALKNFLLLLVFDVQYVITGYQQSTATLNRDFFRLDHGLPIIKCRKSTV